MSPVLESDLTSRNALHSASARVPASAMQDALGPLVLRARLQRMMSAASGSNLDNPIVRVIYDPEFGVSLESEDGAFRTQVRDATVTAAMAMVAATDAKELQRAIAEIGVGMDSNAPPLSLSVGAMATTIEATRSRPIGRTTVMRALTSSAIAEDAPLPLMAAFGVRGAMLANHDRDMLQEDVALERFVRSVRLSLANREYEVWTTEAPAWVLAASDVIEELDTPSKAILSAAADRSLLSLESATEVSEAERDYCHTMILLAACHDARERVPATVRTAVPYAVVASMFSRDVGNTPGISSPTLIPSQTDRLALIVSHKGVKAARPPYESTRTVLERTDSTDDGSLDSETRRIITLVSKGEVRELDPSFALRLTAVPIHVLRGALRAHGKLDDEAMHELSPDERVQAEIVADVWPAATLSPDALNRISTAAGVTALRLDSVAKQRARRKRQDSQRSSRQLTVRNLIPDEIGVGSIRRIRVPSQASLLSEIAIRVTDRGARSAELREQLLVPPASYGLHAVDYNVAVLCDTKNDTAVMIAEVPGQRQGGLANFVVSTWSARPTDMSKGVLLKSALNASPADLIALWGDELIAVRAAAAHSDPSIVANPGDGVAVTVVRKDGSILIEAGDSTLTIGPERAGVIAVIKELGVSVQELAVGAGTTDRRLALTEDKIAFLSSTLSVTAGGLGVGRPVDIDKPGRTSGASARVAILPSVGTGQLSVDDGQNEYIVSAAKFTSRAKPPRVYASPTALNDALDIVRASGTAQEVARTKQNGEMIEASAWLRFSADGESLSFERGRSESGVITVDSNVSEESVETIDVAGSIASVAVRAI